MQINRLFQIIYLLLERDSLTAGELAERFEVSTRTIYRDIDTLSSAGIPVYASKGKGGGIRILPGFVLNKSLLSKEEQNEILFGLQSLSATNAAKNDQILNKLTSLFKKDEINWIDVDFSGWGSEETERQKFELLKTGILQCCVTIFTYYSSYGEKSERQVEPMKLRFKNNAWYLQAFCLQKKSFRTFKICRIHNIQLTEEHFIRRREPPPPLEMSALGAKNISIELWFSPSIAFRVYDEFDSAQIHQNEDGSYHVSVQYPEGSWIYGYLLSFGEDVKVISPLSVQQILIEKAKKITNIYQSNF